MRSRSVDMLGITRAGGAMSRPERRSWRARFATGAASLPLHGATAHSLVAAGIFAPSPQSSCPQLRGTFGPAGKGAGSLPRKAAGPTFLGGGGRGVNVRTSSLRHAPRTHSCCEGQQHAHDEPGTPRATNEGAVERESDRRPSIPTLPAQHLMMHSHSERTRGREDCRPFPLLLFPSRTRILRPHE